MARCLAQARFIIGALAVAFLLAIVAPAAAQQPTQVNPTASSVKEQQLLNALQGGGTIGGRVSIPDQKSGTLIQPGGRDWRQFHEVTLRWVGAIAILGMLVLLVAFYLIRGQVKLESGFSGRRTVRFCWSGDEAGQGWGINREWGGMKLYETMRRTTPDFFVHSGDQIYADGPIVAEVRLDDGTTWKNVTTEAKAKVAETLAEFRGNFAYNLLDEPKRRFTAEVPVLVQWDDHETRNN